MSYLDKRALANDVGFQAQVTIAMANAAVAIAGEAKAGFTDVKYGKRQALAKLVLNDPVDLLMQFSLAIAQDASIAMGAPATISSSTAVYPSVITTSAAHGLATDNTVKIADHAVNTAANGTWTVTVITTTTFSIPVLGVGVGAATGRVTKFPTDIAVQNLCNAVWDDMAGVTNLD